MKVNYLENVKNAFTVKRRIRVPSMKSPDAESRIREHISGMKGVYRVETNLMHKRLTVIYSAAQLDFSAVTVALLDVGCPMENSRWNRIKARWYQFVDENVRANAQVPPTDCCSNPRSIYAKKHK